MGSSSSRMSVSWASAIASQTRWRCPPDSSSTARPARSSTPVASMAERTATSSASDHCRSRRWCGKRPRATRSATVMASGAIGLWVSSPSAAGDLARRPRRDVLAVQPDGARPRPEHPRERAQHRRLAARVGADDDGQRAVRDRDVQLARHHAPVVGELEPGAVQPIRHPRCQWRDEEPAEVRAAQHACDDADGQHPVGEGELGDDVREQEHDRSHEARSEQPGTAGPGQAAGDLRRGEGYEADGADRRDRDRGERRGERDDRDAGALGADAEGARFVVRTTALHTTPASARSLPLPARVGRRDADRTRRSARRRCRRCRRGRAPASRTAKADIPGWGGKKS